MVRTAETVEELTQALDARIHGMDAKLEGSLRVTSMSSLLSHFIADFGEFKRRYPGIELELTSTMSVANLTQREADIAIRVARTAPDYLIGRKYAELHFAVYGSRQLVERLGAETPYREWPWLSWDLAVTRATDVWLENNVQEHRILMRVNTVPLMLDALEAGLGITILNTLDGDADPALRRVGDYLEGGLYVWVLAHPKARGSSRIRVFVNFMREIIERDRVSWRGAVRSRTRDARSARRRHQSTYEIAVPSTTTGWRLRRVVASRPMKNAFLLLCCGAFAVACGSDPTDPVPDAQVDASMDGGATGDSGPGGNDGATDGSEPVDGGTDAALSGCDLGQACCPGSLCSDDSRCVGSVCSCIAEIHGDMYRRTDGTVVHAPSSTVVRNLALDEPLSGITDIYDGHFHGCARRDDGTVWCWGKTSSGNSAGQLGNGSLGGTTITWAATQVMLDATTPLENVERLNDGDSGCYLASTTCGIQADGSVWCWGSGGNGGGGSVFTDEAFSKPYATQIMSNATAPIAGVDQVSLGRRHACALKDGEVWCWGANVGGPLGQNNQDAQRYPTLVTFPGVTQPTVQQVGAGADVTCALADGQVYCWGSTGSGQVGLGEPSANSDGCINFCRLSPARVIDTSDANLDDAIDLNVAYLAVCARRADESLWCWGAGAGNRATPLEVDSTAIIDVAEHTSCGSGNIDQSIRYLTLDNALYAFRSVVDQVCPSGP